jgi:hypothetical protein
MSATADVNRKQAAGEGWSSSGDVDADLTELRALVEADDVEAARALAPKILDRWPDSPRAQHWARVLEPPKARVLHGHPTVSLEQERQWLLKHRHEYPGCWIAVKGDQLVAADPSLKRVHDILKDVPGGERAVIYFEMGEQT